MSFHLNNEQQMAMYDLLYNLIERGIKYLKESGAETFSKRIFPFIIVIYKGFNKIVIRLWNMKVGSEFEILTLARRKFIFDEFIKKDR